MSNIGRNYIPFSERILAEAQLVNNYSLGWISGPLATWRFTINAPFVVTLTDTKISINLPELYTFSRKLNKKVYKPLHSEWSTIYVDLQKYIKSGDVGFTKYLRVIGVGYKFIEDNINELQVQAGFTHLLKQKIHPNFKIKSTRKKRMVRIRSVSFSELTNSLACLRNKRKPNVFTGKGIRFRKQKVWRKTGKKKRI